MIWRITRNISCFIHSRLCSSQTQQQRIFSTKSKSDVTFLDAYHTKEENYRLNIPQRIQHKVVSASDAVSLISNGDTVCVSGFVAQGSPETVLKALGKRYEEEGSPFHLTLLFGGGPGDWETKGLNHLAKTKEKDTPLSQHPPMLRRTIGGHYGQVPQVGQLAISNQVEAWTLPMGSISRMIRSQATHSPGHITTVGIGTYVDPDVGTGGAVNTAALNSDLHSKLVSKVTIQNHDYLMYKSLPIQVAIIRATTADTLGNLSMEHESLLCDQKVIAMAAKNSGGIVIAQVKRLCAGGSLSSREVQVPGPLVDCVVLVDDDDDDDPWAHSMSYTTKHDSVLTGEIRTPKDEFASMPLNIRKVIARRASAALKPGKVINLGIGLPEGVASVAAEEGMLDFITITTEPGVFGGVPASARNFGPAANAQALVEMNQMFDFYDGGGLDMCFLGAAQIGPTGDVNVSRLSKDRLVGPGGFIDISQSTRNLSFLCTFTAKGLDVVLRGDGQIQVQTEGQIKKFVSNVMETTFCGDEAVRRGQKVYYVTERAVFRRSAKYDRLELVEIAPGIDLQRDVLDQMEFTPIIEKDSLKIMDTRIFRDKSMDLRNDVFGSLIDRCIYRENQHAMLIDLFGITINSKADIDWLVHGLDEIISPHTSTEKKKGPLDIMVNYNGFVLKSGLEEEYSQALKHLEKDHYKSVKRFAADKAFRRASLQEAIDLKLLDPNTLFDEFDSSGKGSLHREDIRNGMRKLFGIYLTQNELESFYTQKKEKKTGDDDAVEAAKVITEVNDFANAVRTILDANGRI